MLLDSISHNQFLQYRPISTLSAFTAALSAFAAVLSKLYA